MVQQQIAASKLPESLKLGLNCNRKNFPRTMQTGSKVSNEILKAAQKQKDYRENNLEDTQETIYVDASRNIAVSIGSKDLRYDIFNLFVITTCL